MQVFVDESGDLGFTKKSSNFFVVAFIVPKNPQILGKKLKRQLTRLHRRRKYAGSEFKFSRCRDEVRKIVLEKICEEEFDIGLIILEKRKVQSKLRDANILYNYTVVHHVIRNILLSLGKREKVNIVLDKSLSKSNRLAFNDYVQNKASWIWTQELNRFPPLSAHRIRVDHRDSETESCLQVADLVAGATFHKYEFKNDCYYRIFERKIRYSQYLWR